MNNAFDPDFMTKLEEHCKRGIRPGELTVIVGKPSVGKSRVFNEDGTLAELGRQMSRAVPGS